MTLRAKLVIALVVLSATATVTIGVWSWSATADQLVGQVDASLADTSALLLPPVADGDHRAESDDDAAPATTDDASAGDGEGRGRPVTRGRTPWLHGPWERAIDWDDIRVPGLEQVVVQRLAADGAVLARTAPDPLPVGDAERRAAAATGRSVVGPRTVSVDGERYRVRTDGLGGGLGAVQFARRLGETDEVLSSLRDRIVVAVVAVALLAAALGWVVARQVTRRLGVLAAAAAQVAATGRLDVVVPADGRDEVSSVARSFQSMLDALGRSRAAQQRLVQDAGHELRTPLTSVRANVGVLRRHPDLDDETRGRVLGDLEAEVGELSTLVEEVVQLAVEPGDDGPPVPVRLSDVVRRSVERACRRTGRQILVDADDSAVAGWDAALERAVSNLLDNAAKFSADDTAPIEVTVRAGRVAVADRGPGIDPDDLPLVFDRFHRSVRDRALPGSGLGLAIVRDVAERHGGTVFAERRDGGGACVGFVVPTTADDPRVDVARDGSGGEAGEAGPTFGGRS